MTEIWVKELLMHHVLFNQFRSQILISKDLFLQTLDSSSNTNNKNLLNIINATILNPGQSSINKYSKERENDVQLISKDDGFFWEHYWDRNLHPVLRTYTLSKNQT